MAAVLKKDNRVRIGLTITVFGVLVFLLGIDPDLFGLDRSPVIGYVQIIVFLGGLGITCIGGYISLRPLWQNSNGRSISGDIGSRLIATGYVIAVACGMADLFGFGSQPWPEIPYFGPWQAGGVTMGMLVVAAGFILVIPPSRKDNKSDE